MCCPTFAANPSPLYSEFGGQQFDQVAATAGVAPLIVVPRQNFDAAVADDFGVFGVDDGRIRIALEVGGDQLFFSVGKDAFHWAVRGGLQRRIDGLLRGGLFDENGQVDDADVWCGHAHGVAVELAFEFGNHEVQGFGGAGRTGNHVDRGGTSAAQILVRQVEQTLVVRVGVNVGHRAAVDAESVLQNFGDGREAVRSARGIRDHIVL